MLLGGPSAEHDVSIVSGTAIARALAEAGVDVRQVLIDLDGAWWWLPPDHRRDDRPAAAYDDPPSSARTVRVTVGAALDRLAAADPAPVVVIGLHGPFGEDGTIQAMLEAAGLAYTGVGRGGVGARHGQGPVQAAVPRAWASRSSTGGRSATTRWKADRPGRPARDGRVRRRRGRPAAHGQTGRGSAARSG